MSGIATYILSVTAAAAAAAIVLTLAGQGAMSHLVRLLAGIFVTLAVISPLKKLELPDPQDLLSRFAADGQAAAAMGEDLARDTAHSFIKERVEAYILDKASVYGASLTVDVTLDMEGVPVSVALSGAVSPYAKARLTRILREDLGLGEEAQQWHS